MAVDRIIYCEGPDCGGEGGLAGGHTSCHVQTAMSPPYLPRGFIGVHEDGGNGSNTERHFCGWDCVMKFAAAQPIPERIDLGGEK